MRSFFLSLLACLLMTTTSPAQEAYPHPVRYLSLQSEGQQYRMAYMDVRPAGGTKAAVLLLHGKNFSGYYWKNTIGFLVAAGYRVIAPDQVGWGESDKPLINYSFHQLAQNTRVLLDSLHISKAYVVGHSMGGMLAVRFVNQYPDRTAGLVLENPIGLEDYRKFVPFETIDALTRTEEAASYESYKKYQQSYYPEWKPEYEELVRQQAKQLKDPQFRNIAKVNALTYAMIYEQPVVYEIDSIKTRALLIIGQEDRTIVGKAKLSKAQQDQHGQYPRLGRWLQSQITNSTLRELPGVGHIPHIESPELFKQVLLDFLK